MRYEIMAPIAMIVLGIIASIIYGLIGDIRRSVYWAAVVVITVVITF